MKQARLESGRPARDVPANPGIFNSSNGRFSFQEAVDFDRADLLQSESGGIRGVLREARECPGRHEMLVVGFE